MCMGHVHGHVPSHVRMHSLFIHVHVHMHVRPQATWYDKGDHLTPHTDFHDPGARPGLAFILHMTARWDVLSGGELLWCEPQQLYAPAFNALTLFVVTQGDTASDHAILPVRRRAKEGAMTGGRDGRRLAISGWFYGSRVEETLVKESTLQQRFGTTVTALGASAPIAT